MTAPQTSDCDDCGGTGVIGGETRWAGEAYGEPTSRYCDTCGGTGEIEDE